MGKGKRRRSNLRGAVRRSSIAPAIPSVQSPSADSVSLAKPAFPTELPVPAAFQTDALEPSAPCLFDAYDLLDNANRKRPPGPTTDYGTSMVQWMRRRRRDKTFIEQERPSASYVIDMLPPLARVDRPADSIPAKHMHSSLNKIKHPVNVVKWTPEGRRLLTGSSSGEFTLWNGMGFNFETIMSAHDNAIRAVAWAHSDDWLISCDSEGLVKYWQPNFNNVKEIQAHEACVRDLAFSPTDTKYVTASDDSSVKLWDFASGTEEATFSGHTWDVRSCDWHPSKGLVVSGSRDHLVKLWDPRTTRCLTSLHGHKNTVTKTKFDPLRGNLLATSARDSTARVFDLRMMRDVLLLKGHEKDIMTLTWHPIHHSLLSTAGSDGCMHHYLLDEPNLPEGSVPTRSSYDSPDPSNAPAQTIYPAHRVPFAHESPVWSLDWHPLGHILASGSNDRVTRFWSRARPGETECFHDRYHLGDTAAKAHGSWSSKLSRHNNSARDEDDEQDDDGEALVDQKMPARQPIVPGLPGITAAFRNGTGTGGAQPTLPGMGTPAPPLPMPQPSFAPSQQGFPPPPQIPGMPPQIQPPPGFDPSRLNDPAELQRLFSGRPPPFPIPGQQPGQFPPPPPGFQFQNGVPPPPPGFPGLQQQPQGYPPPPLPPNGSYDSGPVDQNGYGGSSAAANRRRVPLPSQQESLMEEQRRGNYKRSR